MDAGPDEWERLAPCLNVIRHHSLFILPPSSLHAKANLILGLLIVGAFSQAFFQFTSISSSRRSEEGLLEKGRNSCYERVLIQDWLTTPLASPPSPPHTPILFFSPFLSVFDELLFPS